MPNFLIKVNLNILNTDIQIKYQKLKSNLIKKNNTLLLTLHQSDHRDIPIHFSFSEKSNITNAKNIFTHIVEDDQNLFELQRYLNQKSAYYTGENNEHDPINTEFINKDITHYQ